MRRLVIIGVLLTTIALGACGSDDQATTSATGSNAQTASGEPGEAVTAFLAAVAKGDGAAACDLLTESGKAFFFPVATGDAGVTTCSDPASVVVPRQTRKLIAGAKVTGTTADGDKAIVTVATAGAIETQLPAGVEGGKWLVDAPE